MTPAADSVPDDPLRVLQDVFGYEAFRPGQREAIDALLSGRDAIALMPTGGGKSLCYQLPSIVREGTGLVVSPLIALMTDQVEALRSAGVAAACIHGGIPRAERQEVLDALASDALDILYVAPERATSSRFQRVLAEAEIGLVAVDEAHCVDKWGHDFREDYLELRRLRAHAGSAPWFACTATADHRTLDVIRDKLDMGDAAAIRGSYDRPNILYEVVDSPARADELAAWISDEHPDGAGIVYCRTRARTEELAGKLADAGLNAVAYHAGRSDADRRRIEERFRREPAMVVVATVAFGMGIDRSDVRFVVHAEPPDGIDAYMQETGRAGRDGLPASARLYVDERTLVRTSKFIAKEEGPKARVKRSRFTAFLGYLEAATCRRQVLLGFFGESHPGDCGACDNCLDPPGTWDAKAAARAVIATVRATGSRFGANYLVDVLRGSGKARIVDNGHDRLSVHGSGSRWSPDELKIVVRHLLARGVLRADEHGGLHVGDPDGDWSGSLMLREPDDPSEHGSSSGSRDTGSRTPELADEDEALFEALKAKRLEIADARDVPAFVVFHDATLLEMARERPLSEDDLLAVHGVGDAKLEKYGDAFMDVIRDHVG